MVALHRSTTRDMGAIVGELISLGVVGVCASWLRKDLARIIFVRAGCILSENRHSQDLPAASVAITSHRLTGDVTLSAACAHAC